MRDYIACLAWERFLASGREGVLLQGHRLHVLHQITAKKDERVTVTFSLIKLGTLNFVGQTTTVLTQPTVSASYLVFPKIVKEFIFYLIGTRSENLFFFSKINKKNQSASLQEAQCRLEALICFHDPLECFIPRLAWERFVTLHRKHKRKLKGKLILGRSDDSYADKLGVKATP